MKGDTEEPGYWTASKIILLVVATSAIVIACTSLWLKFKPLTPAVTTTQPNQPVGIVFDDNGVPSPAPTITFQRGRAVATEPGNSLLEPGSGGRGTRVRQQWSPPDPGEMANLEAKVKARAVNETTGATAINLKSYVNSPLTDPLADQPDQVDNTLSELPAGVNNYGGVPFDVQGIVQLVGRSVQSATKSWPQQVTGIAIGKQFKKVHLLHGAFNIVAPRSNIQFASLILHYADGSQEVLTIAGGTQALRCVDAAIPAELDQLPAPQTELGWVGSNPYIKQSNPGAALHLYRTTFDNPKPGQQVTAIDYVSPPANPGPFMVGLTVE